MGEKLCTRTICSYPAGRELQSYLGAEHAGANQACLSNTEAGHPRGTAGDDAMQDWVLSSCERGREVVVWNAHTATRLGAIADPPSTRPSNIR